MGQLTDLIKTTPDLAPILWRHLTVEEKAELPLSRDVNIRAVLEIDRGLVRGGMSVRELTRLRPQNGLPLELENPVHQDVNIRSEIVFDVLMYALNKYPEIGQQLEALLGYMPQVVPPQDLA